MKHTKSHLGILVAGLMLVGSAGGCDEAPESGAMELPPLGGGGKADDDAVEIAMERTANGPEGHWRGPVPPPGEPAVATVQLSGAESVVHVDLELSAGEPLLHIRRIEDGASVLQLGADSDKPGGSSGSFELRPGGGGPFQLALFVEDGAGEFDLRITQVHACPGDDDASEPNDEPARAASLEAGIHSGVVCNDLEGLDKDYFVVPAPQTDRILRVGLEHVPSYGQLELTVEDAGGPLDQVNVERTGASLSDPEVVVSFDHVDVPIAAGSELVVVVEGDQAYNVYELLTCLDDTLEGPQRQGTQPAQLEIGARYEAAVLCPVLGFNYATPEPDDVDRYRVDVPAGEILSIQVDAEKWLDFDAPTDAIEVAPNTFEFSAAPSERSIEFSLTREGLDEPVEYDLVIESR